LKGKENNRHPYPLEEQKGKNHSVELRLQRLQQSIQLKKNASQKITCGSCISHISASMTGPMVFKMKRRGSQFIKPLSLFLKGFILTRAQQHVTSISSAFYLRSTPPAGVILYRRIQADSLEHCRKRECVQNPSVAMGRTAREEGWWGEGRERARTAWIPISLLVTPNLHSLPARCRAGAFTSG